MPYFSPLVDHDLWLMKWQIAILMATCTGSQETHQLVIFSLTFELFMHSYLACHQKPQSTLLSTILYFILILGHERFSLFVIEVTVLFTTDCLFCSRVYFRLHFFYCAFGNRMPDEQPNTIPIKENHITDGCDQSLTQDLAKSNETLTWTLCFSVTIKAHVTFLNFPFTKQFTISRWISKSQ